MKAVDEYLKLEKEWESRQVISGREALERKNDGDPSLWKLACKIADAKFVYTEKLNKLWDGMNESDRKALIKKIKAVV